MIFSRSVSRLTNRMLSPFGNTIEGIATGGDFLERWKKIAMSGWEKYCRRHGLGFIVFDEKLTPKNSLVWEKAHWQKMIMGNVLKKESPRVKI